MTTLIDERDERTKERKKIKKRMDEIIGLSSDKSHKAMLSMSVNKLADKTIRLLDEGYIDNGFVIKKGAMEKFLNGENEKVRGWEWVEDDWRPTEVLNIEDDFVGSVNLGHMDFATFPFIIGEWNREDLSLVDIGNDRKAIDVALHLDEDSVFVKELKRQPYDIGVSAEFWANENEEDTEALSELLGTYMPVYDEIYIFAYGLVGECGNVNSSGLELSGGTTVENKKIEEILEESEVDEILEEELAEEPVKEEEAIEEAEVEEVEEVEDEEVEGEEVEEDEEAEDEEVEDEEDGMETINEAFEKLQSDNAELSSKVEALEKKVSKLQRKLKAKNDEIDKFAEKFSGVAVSLGLTEEKKEEVKEAPIYKGDNGIGEL